MCRISYAGAGILKKEPKHTTRAKFDPRIERQRRACAEKLALEPKKRTALGKELYGRSTGSPFCKNVAGAMKTRRRHGFGASDVKSSTNGCKKQLSSSRPVAVCFEKIFGFDYYYYYSKPPHGNRNQMFFWVLCVVFRCSGLMVLV